jgi:pimeloyl-ACP methyl ester carboxylesterase
MPCWRSSAASSGPPGRSAPGWVCTSTRPGTSQPPATTVSAAANGSSSSPRTGRPDATRACGSSPWPTSRSRPSCPTRWPAATPERPCGRAPIPSASPTARPPSVPAPPTSRPSITPASSPTASSGRAAGGYRAIAHDRRGHGRSSQPWDGNDLDTYADDLAALIDTLDLHQAILIIHGDDDQIVPIGASALLSSKLVKDATHKVYPGAPHGLFATHKDQFNTDLLAFIRA